MKERKRIRTYQILGVIIALSSLILSIGTLTTTYAYTGMATISKEKYNVEIKDVTDPFSDGKNIKILKNPKIMNDKIIYGVLLSETNDYTKFQFTIENTGNVNAKINEINITGLEEFKDYIDIQILGLPENKIIAENTIAKIDVITTYKNALRNEEGTILPITLNEISVNAVLEKE